jgi:hypothetical protein
LWIRADTQVRTSKRLLWSQCVITMTTEFMWAYRNRQNLWIDYSVWSYARRANLPVDWCLEQQAVGSKSQSDKLAREMIKHTLRIDLLQSGLSGLVALRNLYQLNSGLKGYFCINCSISATNINSHWPGEYLQPIELSACERYASHNVSHRTKLDEDRWLWIVSRLSLPVRHMRWKCQELWGSPE